MPPPKKAARKSAGHHNGRHRQANELRRAFEHMGRMVTLRKSLDPSTADAAGAVGMLAQIEIKAGRNKDAADLPGSSEHLGFATLAHDGLAAGRKTLHFCNSAHHVPLNRVALKVLRGIPE